MGAQSTGNLDGAPGGSFARLPPLYRLVAGVPIIRENLLTPLQRDGGRRRNVRIRLCAWDIMAYFVVDEALNHIFLVSAHNGAADPGVVRLGPEVARVHWVAPIFERNQVVLLVARHVVGVGHAAGGINLAGTRVDEFRPRLVHGVAVFPKLLPLQFARIFRRGPNDPGAPLPIADVVLDVPLSDVRIGGS